MKYRDAIQFDSFSYNEETLIDLDRNEFFRQVAKRICGSLDIETAKWRCLPVTMLTIAQVTRYDATVKLDRIVSFPEEARA